MVRLFSGRPLTARIHQDLGTLDTLQDLDSVTPTNRSTWNGEGRGQPQQLATEHLHRQGSRQREIPLLRGA